MFHRDISNSGITSALLQLVKENAQIRRKVPWSSVCILMTEFYGHKNLMTQRKIGLSCILFSKTQVCQRLLKNPNAAYPLMLVPRSRQVWSHSPLVQAVQVPDFFRLMNTRKRTDRRMYMKSWPPIILYKTTRQLWNCKLTKHFFGNKVDLGLSGSLPKLVVRMICNVFLYKNLFSSGSSPIPDKISESGFLSLGKIRPLSDATQACSWSSATANNYHNANNCVQLSTNRRDDYCVTHEHTVHQARNQGGGLSNFCSPPWKNVLDIVQKIWASLRKLFAPWWPKLITGLHIMLNITLKARRRTTVSVCWSMLSVHVQSSTPECILLGTMSAGHHLQIEWPLMDQSQKHLR